MQRQRMDIGANLDIRWAKKADARDIARFFLISSDGLAAYIWGKMDRPGLSLEEIGAARYAREETAFSYQNCQLAVMEGATIGMAHAFEMAADAEPSVEEDPVLRPYAELEDPGSLYLSGLAVSGRHRGHGIGAVLMEHVEKHARSEGLARVSLICFERNEWALRFYTRRGYREIARRALVPHPSLHYRDGDALLLVRDV